MWFLVLAFLCYQGHQWFRHLVGAALCSGVGTVTFTVATTTQPCLSSTFVALSGPLFTFGLEWLGMLLLLWAQTAQVGYALVFASFAHLRFIQTLTGRGDELLFAHQRLASPSVVLVAAAVFAIGLPPLIQAYRAIANQRRALVFAGSYLLPLPLLFAVLLVSRFLYGEGGDEIQGAAILGVPVLVLATHAIAVALFGVLSHRLRLQGESSVQ
jgi:NADH:ubiquinone oxidoreductase subunit 6 (subunit J)